MKDLADVLKQLDEAEKEYKEKCLKYGIQEKRKNKETTEQVVEENTKTPNKMEMPIKIS